jgi:hypothetical protein
VLRSPLKKPTFFFFIYFFIYFFKGRTAGLILTGAYPTVTFLFIFLFIFLTAGCWVRSNHQEEALSCYAPSGWVPNPPVREQLVGAKKKGFFLSEFLLATKKKAGPL